MNEKENEIYFNDNITNIDQEKLDHLEFRNKLKEELLKKIESINNLQNQELLVHGTKTYPKDENDDPFSLLKNILKMGLLTPKFINKAKDLVNFKTDEAMSGETLKRPSKNPHNEYWISLLKLNPKKSQENPIKLAAGYAGFIFEWGKNSGWISSDKEDNLRREKYIFVCDQKLKVTDLSDSLELNKIQMQYNSTMHNEGEQLRFARISPSFFMGLIIPKDVEEEKKPKILSEMKNIFKNKSEKYLPIYDMDGNLLWPQIENEDKNKFKIIDSSIDYLENISPNPDSLLDNVIKNNNAALLFLKGGEYGGMNIVVKEKIINFLSRWFDVIEGDIKKPSLKEISTRWMPGMKYQFDKMRKNNHQRLFNINRLENKLKSCLRYKEDELKESYEIENNLLKKYIGHDSGFLRQQLILDYFSKEGQTLFLKLKQNISKKNILEDLDLYNLETITNIFGPDNSTEYFRNPDKIPCNKFIKKIIVGETTSYKAKSNTIRNIVATELKNGALKKTIEYAKKLKNENPNVWKVEEGDYNELTDDEDTVISTFLNAIHTIDFSKSEFGLMSNHELDIFNKSLESK